MKKFLKIIIPSILIICMLLSSFPTGAKSFSSLAKNPVFNHGIDVSQWNGDLDWNKLRNSGVEFAYIRIGYYHTGQGYVDYKFKENLKGCVENGIDFGIYVYSYVYSYSETVKCAKWVKSVLDTMGNYTKDKDTIQVAYDIEDEVQSNAVRNGKISRTYLHNGVQKFCDKIKSYGYEPIVYSFSSFFQSYLYLSKFQDKGIRIWYASWPYTPNLKVKKVMENGTYADIWQFSSSYTINGAVFDTNVCYDDFYDYSKEDSKLTIKNLKSSYSYKSSGVKPSIKVYSGSTLLKKGSDYKVFYYKNKRTGRARMKIVRYKNGKYYESKTVKFIIRPVAVKNLKAKPSTDNISLKWDKLNGAIGYQIQEFDPYDSNYNLIDTVKTTSYTNCFLDEGKEYKLRVRAVTKLDGAKVYGNYATVTVKTMYKAVKLKSVSSAAKGKATVKWTPKTENTKGYIIHYSKDKYFKTKKSYKIKKKTINNTTISGLSSKTRYYFRVKAYNYVDGKYFYSKYSSTKSVVIK
ncbi:MAG: fibronectin type III domain-containing protein [Ruminococcus sp.]|nr:fibronectin type III domain-containing protein [Ruminococcus sp.]